MKACSIPRTAALDLLALSPPSCLFLISLLLLFLLLPPSLPRPNTQWRPQSDMQMSVPQLGALKEQKCPPQVLRGKRYRLAWLG